MTSTNLYVLFKIVVSIGVDILSIITLLSVGYCFLLLISAWVASRHKDTSIPSKPVTRFCLLIPAHNEELVIEATLSKVMGLNYPSELFHCVVIADNCVDNTASIVRRVGGNVRVLERINLEERGKGYALNWAIDQVLTENQFDQLVIIDADTFIDQDFLHQADRVIQRDSPSNQGFVGQGYYKVLNDAENWRTALMAGALSLVHYVRPMARELWETSVGLKGNGMVFSVDVAKNLKWRGDSLTEDLEYGIDLIEKHGIRVRFLPNSIVRAQMPTDESASSGQRKRWEGGRQAIVRERALYLLFGGISKCDKLRLDAGLDLICPPLAQLAVLQSFWGLMLFMAFLAKLSIIIPFVIWIVSIAMLVAYVIGGFKLGGAPRAAFQALGMAVVYIPWKIATMLSRRKKSEKLEWVRTERKQIIDSDIQADKPMKVVGK